MTSPSICNDNYNIIYEFIITLYINILFYTPVRTYKYIEYYIYIIKY